MKRQLLGAIFFLSLFVFTSQLGHSKTSNETEIKFSQDDRDNIKKSILLLETQQKQIDDFKYYTNQRFDSQDKRLDNIWNLILVLIASIIGSVAYMFWDRREANRPLKEKLEAQEKEIDLLKSQVKELMNKAAML